jgi:hypothetical protein
MAVPLLALLALSAACAAPTYWTRPGGGPGDAAIALESCKAVAAKPAATQAVAPSLPQSPAYATGFVIAVVDPPPNGTSFHGRVRDCMRRQGWNEASGPS